MTETRVIRAGAERIGELEPLWAAMHAHHSTLAPEMWPTRDLADSWRRRRAQYERWLSGEEATLLIAERDGAAVGYAVVTVQAGPATWALGERVAELESLAVLDAARGEGVGALLVAAARETARAAGAPRLSVGVAHADEGALRFYEREGFRPFYVQLLDGGEL